MKDIYLSVKIVKAGKGTKVIIIKTNVRRYYDLRCKDVLGIDIRIADGC